MSTAVIAVSFDRAAEATAADRIFLAGTCGAGRWVAADAIVAILSAENYSQVLLQDGERWMLRRTMHAWECALPAEQFARVHRCAIVNLRRVERIERDRDENTALILRGYPRPLPVGRRVWPRLKTRFYLSAPTRVFARDEPALARIAT